MKTKYKILLGIISLALLASLYIAQSYALWTFTAPQTTTNSVSSGCFDIEYSETASSTLNLTQSYPIDDAQALSKETPYTFTIKNNCSISTEYTVTLNTLTSNTLDDAKIKYAIVSGSSTTTTGKKLSEATANADTTNFNLGSTLKKSYKLATGVLTQSSSVTFKLYLWMLVPEMK